MKGMLEWLKANTKIKRWIFAILIGVVFACLGISKIMVAKELNVAELLKIVGSFVLGFTLIVVGIISIQKRTLEILIEASDDRLKQEKKVNVNSLIFNKKIYEQGPKVVVLGGGSGLDTVLKGLKKYTNNITAIVSVSNYGKKNENNLDILPMDDIKDGIIALSKDEDNMEALLNYRFRTENLRGTKFSDILFSTIAHNNNNFSKAIESTNKILNITGKVLPVTLDEMEICAELENGMVVKEKEKIPEMVYSKITKINRIYLNPTNCRTTPEVVKAIKEADCIVYGPGSLYTNVIPNLLVNGVAKAIKESKAIKIYINNIMTEPGQTDDYSVEDHIKAIIDHCGEGLIDYCIYDTGEVIPEYIKKYNKEGADLVEQKINDPRLKRIKFIKKNISTIIDDKIRHDPYLIAESAITLICNDMKFQDKESDPEYLMLNAKLQSDKRINKLKKEKIRMDKKAKRKGIDPNKKDRTKHQGKFSAKYSERIQSIKDSDKERPKKIEK